LDLVTFVIDDDDAERASLVLLLRKHSIRARSYPSATAFLDQLSSEHRGCIVTDFRMPKVNGIALIERLRERCCPMPVVVITGYADVRCAVAAMKAGAADFIAKPYDGDLLLSLVRKCLASAQDYDTRQTQTAAIRGRIAGLTQRERQVFAAVADGRSNKEVAKDLSISPRTVEVHRARLMNKMQAKSLPDLVGMRLISRAA
jgi:two-component system response regulator FixJ